MSNPKFIKDKMELEKQHLINGEIVQRLTIIKIKKTIECFNHL
ncbi:hypothetical protein BH18ACI1_BH18ACI1_19500 [soil metagenome]